MVYSFQMFQINAILVLFYIAPTFSEWEYWKVTEWEKEYKDCNGKNQSPIKLFTPEMRLTKFLRPLKFNGYDNVPSKMTLHNNGHTLLLEGSWSVDKIPTISGGPLQDEYVFRQLHFHWGPNNCAGSEHILNGISFPLELHLVHFKKSYGNFEDAVKHKDGLSVIGVLYDIRDTGVQGIANILSKVASVLKIKTTVHVAPFALSTFGLISDSQKYATYSGSLTIPPCSEIVTWILPLRILNVTEAQIGAFRSVYFDHFDIRNYRVAEPLNDRTVFLFS